MSRTIAIVAALTFLAGPASALVFTVDTPQDLVDTNSADDVCQTAVGSCSLRAAIQQANATAGDDTVQLQADTTYVLTIAGAAEDASATADLDITETGALISVVGAGPDSTVVDANQLDRAFDALADLDLRGLTIRNGAPGSSFPFGGGVFNDANVTLTMTDVAIHDCRAAHGGAVHNDLGTLLLTRVSLSANEGSIAGGGLESNGVANLLNVTLSGNTGGLSPGFLNDGEITLTNVTLVGNRIVSSGETTVKNSIFSNSTCPASGVSSSGYNLDDGTTCPFSATGDLSNVDPLLGPLQNNGGGTLTHALQAGSPAIDAGSLDCPPPSDDQRGEARPVGTACDIGAYEFDPGVPPTVTTTSTSIPGTTTTLPGGTTTTTLPPGCPMGPTFPSAECRVLDLMTRTVQVGEAIKLRDKFVKLLDKADIKLGTAQEKLALQKTRPARKQVGKARKFVKRFGKKVGSKKGAKVILNEADRLDLQTDAQVLEADLLTLKDSLL